MITDDRRPRAYTPARYQTVGDVRIGFGESLGYLGRLTLKQQDRAVRGLGESSAEDELTALARLPRELQVLGTESGAALEIVRRQVVEQEEMHALSMA